jgi:drug/metabolite transporter (DMT)-like permease
MLWLIVAISAYFILAVVFLVDKYLLTKAIPNPKVYAFYVGTLGILVLVLAPFVGFYIPEKSQIALSLLAGAVFVYGLFWFYKTLQLFEASRAVPAIGGLTPLFTFGLIYLFTSGREVLSSRGLIAFILLVLGSILINLKKEKLINLKSFKFSILTAFFFSLAFVLTKYIYLVQPFWNGFIWKSIGGFLMAACFFIFFPEIKKEIFRYRVEHINYVLSEGEEEDVVLFAREKFQKKTAVVFLSNQAAGAGAAILQNWAIFLAPLAYVPVIHALNGTQYVFLFIFSIFLSLKFPQILKEEISKEVLFQKIIAILLIGGGLILLSL